MGWATTKDQNPMSCYTLDSKSGEMTNLDSIVEKIQGFPVNFLLLVISFFDTKSVEMTNLDSIVEEPTYGTCAALFWTQYQIIYLLPGIRTIIMLYILSIMAVLLLPKYPTQATVLLVGTILYSLYSYIGNVNSNKRKKESATLEEIRCRCELKDFHLVGFCTSCVKQTRLHWHCDGCGGHSRYNIVKHIVRNGRIDNICTRCFHLARFPHHCDFCKNNRGGSNGIVGIQ